MTDLIERLEADNLLPADMEFLVDEAAQALRDKNDEIARLNKLLWLAGQDWVFFSDEGKPALLTNDIFVRAADAYPINLEQVDELYAIAQEKGYDGLIEWICKREGWKTLDQAEDKSTNNDYTYYSLDEGM